MPNNLYRQLNQSVLIDVEGVLLAPMGELIINAPSGFSEVKISLPRGEKSHGFNYEFSDAETPFGFDKVKFDETDLYSPYSFIKDIYEFSGVDAAVMFEFRARKTADVPFESQYLGDLDFEEVEILDLKINVTSRRKNLDDLFRTRQKTKVSFGATESIDGEAITGLVADDVFLHSKVLSFTQKAHSNDAPSLPSLSFSSDTQQFLSLDYSLEVFGVNPPLTGYSNQINSLYGNGVQTGFSNEDFLSPQYNFNEGGRLYINYEADYFVSSTSIIPSSYQGTFIRVNDTIYNVSAITGSVFIQFTYSDVINIPKGASFYIYDIWITDGLESSYGVFETTTNHVFELYFESVDENSTTKAYKPFEATNHILEVINNRTDMLISSFITNEANDIYQANGYSIRGFDDRPPETSFNDQFYKWLQPMFGLGFAVVYDVDKFKVLIERYSHFYQDAEIDYFDSTNDGSWSITADKSVIFNEFEVGYLKFPSSTDENKQNTIDEFNTVHTDLSPIKTVEKKATYKSDAIGSGYLLENSRREQFKEVPSDTVTNDDNMFLVKTVLGVIYTIQGQADPLILSVQFDEAADTIAVNGTWYDLQIGDSIDIQRVVGASALEGIYNITSVTNLGTKSVLSVSEDILVDGEFFDDWTLDVTSSSRLRAERNENFDVLNNVISPETSYNVGLNPKNMLLNQSPLFNSGFHPKPDTAEIKTQTVKLNGEMESQFSVGEGGYVLDPDRQLIKQNQTLALSQVNQNIKLFTGRLIKFTTTINYDRVLLIRDACLNVSTGGDNYGYIRVKDPFGVDYKGFIMNMEYNPLSEEVDFELREKFD